MTRSPLRDINTRYEVIEEAAEKDREYQTKTRRWQMYTDIEKWDSDWSKGPIEIDGYLVGGDRGATSLYFISTKCHEHENTGQEPDRLCPCRARVEWNSMYNSGLARKYRDLPDEWDLHYRNDLDKDEQSFSWDVISDVEYDDPDLF